MSGVSIHQAGTPQVIAVSDGSHMVRIPVAIHRRGGRKAIMPSEGEVRPWHREPTPLQRALVRGQDWLALLEAGEVASITELAEREGVQRAAISRCLNWTTLAPARVAAILDETLPAQLTLVDLATTTPLDWEEQRVSFGVA